MSGRLILYTSVLAISAALGFLASYMLAGAPPVVAEPVSLKERAGIAMADVSATPGADFTMPNMLGGDSNLSDWEGKPRLINFWATWCAPCRREIPLLKTLQDAQQPDGLQVIGIAFDEMDAVKQYAVEADFNYPILVGEEDAVAAAEAFDIELMALPFTLVVSGSGELINAHIGEIEADEADAIIDVMRSLESGDIDLAAARAALSD